jgi:hypothetical protein
MDADGLFPGMAADIPLTEGPVSIIEPADLTRASVRHGLGYHAFASFCDARGPGAAALAGDPRALLRFLSESADVLHENAELARAADIFLGNCLNFAHRLTWISSRHLAIARDELSVTIEGAALVLAMHPRHQDVLLTELTEHGADEEVSK